MRLARRESETARLLAEKLPKLNIGCSGGFYWHWRQAAVCSAATLFGSLLSYGLLAFSELLDGVPNGIVKEPVEGDLHKELCRAAKLWVLFFKLD